MHGSRSMNCNPPNNTPTESRSPLAFFVLVFALSIPFWLAGAVTSLRLLPGLPVSALMFVCPGTAALILAYRKNRLEGVIKLLKRGGDYRRIKARIWFAPVILLMPTIMILSYLWMRWTGAPVPPPHFSIAAIIIMMFAFFLSALAEELGWSGYVTDLMQERRNALETAALLGLVWAVWHFVPLLQVHRSLKWIAWWTLGTVAARILIVWIYNNVGRSVFAATVFHATINLSWQLSPVNGSYYDPRITGLMLAFVAAIVIFAGGPGMQTRSGGGTRRKNAADVRAIPPG